MARAGAVHYARTGSETLVRSKVVAAAYLLDWLIGDPEGMPHPVRLFGRCISWADQKLRGRSRAAQNEFAIGIVLAVGLPVATYFATLVGLRQLRYRQKSAAIALEIILGATCLATRNLLEEASRVISALEQHDLPTARFRLARIVGRDTHVLNESEISRAVIETLAESLADGVIAPLFYLVLGGVPAALSYKAINTMDSMIGHKDDRYMYFGKAAARLDDAANLIPSRISAFLLCVAALAMPTSSGDQAFRTWMADGSKHKSPNSGQPESAIAGALQVRLGGTNVYDGEPVETPMIGGNFKLPTISDARTAIKITALASLFGCGLALFYLRKRR
jgi:adenosylcobinamide-phosphate synthase